MRRTLAVTGIVGLGLLITWILVFSSGSKHPPERGRAPEPLPAPILSGKLDGEATTLERRGDSGLPISEDPLTMLDSAIVCQVVGAAGQRSPLHGAEIHIQLEQPIAVDPIASATSDANGIARVGIPIGRKIVVHGFSNGIMARRDLPEMSEQQFRERHPNGVTLDFFFDPVQVNYSVLDGQALLGQVLYLSISTRPLARMIMPRDGELTDVLRAPGEGRAVTGSFKIQSGAELHWALMDQFGISLLQGRSGRVHEPNDQYNVSIDLDEAKVQGMRHFQITEGHELFNGPFMSNVALQVFDEAGDYYGSTQGEVSNSGRFSLVLPSSVRLRLVLHHPRVAATELLVDESEGLSAEQPIQIRANAAARVFFRKADFPTVLEGQSVTIVLKNGKWRPGVVMSVETASDALELIGGWSKEVHSFRLGDQLFLVRLKDESEVWLPCEEIIEIPLPEILDCTIEVQAASILEQTTTITFLVRGELWQIHRIYSTWSRQLTFSTRLPAEPGVVIIREGNRDPERIPYTVDAGGLVNIPWINH